MRILSLQSGTSADGIDVAVVDIEQADGSQTPALRLTTVLTRSVDWDESLRARILAAADGAAIGAQELCELDALTGQAFAAAAEAAIREATAVDLVVSHGQTLHHWVDASGARGTLQTGEASWIAEACSAPVLSNLRAADIAAGGDGAPLMGVFDRAWLGETVRHASPVATLNLGGIANVSVLDADRPDLAWDTGPGNVLIDAVVARATGGALGYDEGGRIGAAGVVHEGALGALLEHPFLRLAAPKSTGRETFGLPVVDGAAGGLELADLVATLARFTARTIADGLRANAPTLPSRLIASGGGVHNPVLMAAIAEELAPLDVQLETCGARGVDPDFKESLMFALLGFLTWHGIPCELAASAPGRARLAGQLTFGPRAVTLPRPLDGIRGITVMADRPALAGVGR
jgi:anhydro-N-acetylmuramic acid kinase